MRKIQGMICLPFPEVCIAAEFAEALDESSLDPTALEAKDMAEVGQLPFVHRSAILQEIRFGDEGRKGQKHMYISIY